MSSRGDRTARGPGHFSPGPAANAAAPAATSASTPAGGSASRGGAAQPGSAPSAADEHELRGLVHKLLAKVALERHGRAAELAEQAAELATSMVRTTSCAFLLFSRLHITQYGSNSLAVAKLHMTAVGELYNLAVDETLDVDKEAAYDRAWTSLHAAIAIIQLRLNAGTLLHDAVREEERLFYTIYDLAARAAQGEPLPNDAVQRAASSVVGYDALLDAAHLALRLLRIVQSCPAAERQRAQRVVLAALDAIPATAGLPVACGSELAMAGLFQQGLAADAGCLDAAFHASVLAKWTSPAVVNKLRLRGSLQTGVTFLHQALEADAVRKKADVAARGFRICGLPSCGKREATVRHFKLCGGCDAVAYCCDEHHGVHWREGHRRECRHLRAAGAKPPSTADAA